MFSAGRLTVRSPGKLILSGEHSVVYGGPAIAMAIDRYTQVTAQMIQQPLIKLKMFDFGYTCSHTLNALKDVQRRVLGNYSKFLKGQCSIKEVLTMPFELLQFSVTNVIEKLNLQIPSGLHIEIGSGIPVGCGMGSSAAAVVGTLHAVLKHLGVDLENNKFLSISRESENLQHGKSSGLDIYITKNGGTCRFERGEITNLDNPNQQIYMINTGAPASSTGECVSTVAHHFNRAALVDDFANVTRSIESAIKKSGDSDLIYGIKENHRLLTSIGVVPSEIQGVISKVEGTGGAAKICGAGAISGSNAGIIMLVGDKDKLTNVTSKYGYTLETFDVDVLGTHVI